MTARTRNARNQTTARSLTSNCGGAIFIRIAFLILLPSILSPAAPIEKSPSPASAPRVFSMGNVADRHANSLPNHTRKYNEVRLIPSPARRTSAAGGATLSVGLRLYHAAPFPSAVRFPEQSILQPVCYQAGEWAELTVLSLPLFGKQKYNAGDMLTVVRCDTLR
jgi:hypothetical protein